MYTIVQQGGVLFFMVLAGEIIRLVVQDLVFDRGFSWGLLFPPLVSFMIWPFLYLALSRLKFRVRVE